MGVLAHTLSAAVAISQSGSALEKKKQKKKKRREEKSKTEKGVEGENPVSCHPPESGWLSLYARYQVQLRPRRLLAQSLVQATKRQIRLQTITKSWGL